MITVHPNKAAELVLADFCLPLHHVCGGVSAIYSLYINSRWCANSHYSTYICGNSKRADTWSTDGACELHRIDDYILPHLICSTEHESQGKTSTFFQGCSSFSPRLAFFWASQRVSGNFISVRVCQKSSLSFLCHNPDCHSRRWVWKSLSCSRSLSSPTHGGLQKQPLTKWAFMTEINVCAGGERAEQREHNSKSITLLLISLSLPSLFLSRTSSGV